MPPCPSCAAEMPREFRFCGMCGIRLPAEAAPDACGLCGAPAPADAFECPGCHAPLESALARMLSQERKVVTVVFGDLVGFTRRSSDRDPEEVKELVDRCFHRLSEVIESHGGWVDKYVGDGLLALFGVPRTQEDDADRALAAAAAMQEAIGELAKSGPASAAPPLSMRVAVHTGEAIVGAIAGREDRGITAIGDTVNIASRLQGACAPGSVWVTQATRDAARGEFRFGELPPIMVKGKPRPITVFELEGVARQGRPTTRRLYPTRFVGREAESARLRDHLEGTARQGRLGAAVVVGEAGIGKTRLLREFRRGLAGASVWWSEEDAYVAGPYAPFLRMLRDRWAAGEPGTSDAAWRAVFAGIQADSGPDLAREMEAALGPVIAPTRHGIADPDPHGEHRERVRHAFVRLFREAAARQIVVVGLDNLHAADPSSVDLANHLVQSGRDDPVFFLVTSRPDRNERIARLRDLGALVLPLDPLPAEAGLSIVADVARDSRIGDRVRAQIVERSGGNPLFLEEIVRAFLQGASAASIPDELPAEIPGTLFSALAARIDTLDPREKQVLQMASVVGRVFWRSILVHLAGGDVDPVIARLEEQGLIYRQDVFQFHAGEEWVFRHALVHEVVYGTLLKKTRKDLHRWVAEHMAQTHALETLELASLAAFHFRSAGAHAEAAKLYARAGELSILARADEEAAEYFARAYELVDALAAGGEVEDSFDFDGTRARLAMQRAGVLLRLGRYDDALAALAVVERTAKARADADLGAEAAAERARILAFQGRFTEAVELARRGTDHWRTRNQPARLAQAHFLEGEIHFLSGRLENVFMSLKNAQDHFDRAQDASGRARCLFQLGFVLAARGFHDQAYKALEQSLQSATDPDSARSLAGQGKLAVLLAERGDLEGAIAALRSVVAACAQRGLRRAESGNRTSLGMLLTRRGLTSPAREELDRALAVKSQIGDRRGRALCLLNLAETWQADAEYGRALHAFGEALDEARAASDLSVEAKVKLAEARARFEIADRTRAEALFGEAIDLAKGAGLRWEEGLAILGRARTAERGMLGSLQLGKAETVAREIGSRPLAAEIQLARAEAAHAKGDLAQAEAHARSARDTAATCGRPALELRAGIAFVRAAAAVDGTVVEAVKLLAAQLKRPVLDLELEDVLARRADQTGDRKAAKSGRERAAALTQRIATSCGDAALAKAFLASDRVRAILSGK